MQQSWTFTYHSLIPTSPLEPRWRAGDVDQIHSTVTHKGKTYPLRVYPLSRRLSVEMKLVRRVDEAVSSKQRTCTDT